MIYGPNTEAVQAFISSLPKLTENELEASVDAMFSTYARIVEWQDTATKKVWAAASAAARDDEVVAAQVATHTMVHSLGWTRTAEQTLDGMADRAVGAIVVVDCVPILELAPAFRPFRYTSAELPIVWGA